MPRIRKRTSRRGTTAQRAKIQGKVAESRKKAKKAAKRDVTWKSKKSKDPGIPNNFPYKDQILAEIAEERRLALEAKARRKEEKKALRAQQKNAALGADGEHGSDDEENAEDKGGGFDGVATFDARAKAPPSTFKKSAGGAHGAASTTEDGVPPLLMNPELPHLAAVLDKADVVIEILDARDPLAHRSKALEAQVSLKEGRRLLLVLNKIDGCPRESTAAWAAHLRAEHPTLLFRAASSFLPPTVKYDPTKGKGKEKEPSDDAWGLDGMNTLLGRWAHEKAGDGPLHVAVVGLTNSGKSAFVNSLARRTTLDVYAPSSSTHNSPTTTPHALEVTLELDGKPVVFIDTPGLAWQPSEDASPEDKVRHRAQDVLLRNKGRIDHLKDPIPAVSYIVSRAETEDLMVHYCLPAFARGDADAFLMGVARANALVKKGGDPDLVGAARLVLRDWSTGKLPRYAVPPPIIAQQADGDPTVATIYADDDALLERLVPRKELRRSRDVVRLSSGQVDERALAFEAPWFGSSAAAAAAGSESDEDGEMEASDSGLASDGDENAESDAQASVRDEEDGDGGGDGSDDDPDAIEADDTWHVDDGDGNEDDGATTTARSSPARKRKLPPSTKRPVDPARPTKKVAFAATVASLNGAAKTSSKGRSALRQAPASAKIVSARAAASIVTAADEKLTTGPTSKKNGSKKSKIALARAPPAAAQSTVRRSGPIKPAANAPTAVQKRKSQAGAAASEEGAYDFSKFF
ncbi:hypothetical protein EDB92DRAFT_1834090 [Lactarius akahatsu]|uniref:Uncharacterized protein n=1 Tax=Lactarius akahatsu TaxID=416441 RepID=A0AAD4LPM3_9AGAM|nr:hypothetical protein EDB92DRAFT_1834090 [Lactarius akahatsu]